MSHNQIFNYKKWFSTGSKKGLTVAQRKPIQEGFRAFLAHPQRFGVWNLVVWLNSAVFRNLRQHMQDLCCSQKQPYWVGVALNLFSFIFFSLWLFSFNINHINGLFQFWRFALNNSFAQRSWNSVVMNNCNKASVIELCCKTCSINNWWKKTNNNKKRLLRYTKCYKMSLKCLNSSNVSC